MKTRSSDLIAAQFIISHIRYYGESPSYTKMANMCDYTRQNAYGIYQRLVEQGLLVKSSRGRYKLLRIPKEYLDVEEHSTKELYEELYLETECTKK